MVMSTPRPIPGFLWIVQLSERINFLAARCVRNWPLSDRDSLGDQLSRAVDSIGLNISEGYARFHLKERLHFLSIANGSLEEALFAVRRARDRELLSPLDASILSGLLIKLRKALDTFTKELEKG
jgi:four helix bundle protein